MTRSLALLVLTATSIITLTATAAGASCLATPARVVTVTVVSCQESNARWEETRAGDDMPDFYREQVERALEGHTGVVVTGTVTHAVEVTSGPQGYTVPGVGEADGAPEGDPQKDGEWFVALPKEAMEGDPCVGYREGETVEIYSPPVCCDMLPPQDAACIHGVRAGAPVPEELRTLLDADS